MTHTLTPTADLATDIEDGQLIDSFGDGGRVDLNFTTRDGETLQFNGTSPPLVVIRKVNRKKA